MRAVESSVFPAPWNRRVAFWPGETRLGEHYVLVTGVLLVLLILNELHLWGPNVLRWDWLFVSGVLTFLVALKAALLLPDRVHEALSRLAARQVLRDRQDRLDDFLDDFEQRLHASSRRSAAWRCPRCSGPHAGVGRGEAGHARAVPTHRTRGSRRSRPPWDSSSAAR